MPAIRNLVFMNKNDYFGSVGMALSCTLFLEGALKKYKNFAGVIDEDTIILIEEWNKVLLCLLKADKYKNRLGTIGNKLIKNASVSKEFVPKCVDDAHDVSVQALHYALRFQESVSFLNDKLNQDKPVTFCDLGCGLSPLSAVFQARYDLPNVFCVDVMPEIAELYTKASYELSRKMPTFIDWDAAKKMAKRNEDTGLNTVVSVGCLPHMDIETQKQYLGDINKRFDNFFVEVKYKKQEDMTDASNAFNLSELQRLRLDVENVDSLETAMIRNSIRYLMKFVRSKSDRIDFLINRSRSLFLSR